jgi:ATP-dependent DNA ligase
VNGKQRIKYKVNKSQEFVIGGYTPGNPLDAVIVGHYDGDKLITRLR